MFRKVPTFAEMTPHSELQVLFIINKRELASTIQKKIPTSSIGATQCALYESGLNKGYPVSSSSGPRGTWGPPERQACDGHKTFSFVYASDGIPEYLWCIAVTHIQRNK